MESRTQIIVAVIGLVGTLGAALIYNWKDISENYKSPSGPSNTPVISPANAHDQCCDLNGNYIYRKNGIAEISQKGDDVEIFLTWSPSGAGPHYKVKAKLKENVLEGEWYSLLANSGWHYFYAEISHSGEYISFENSIDPIGAEINGTVLVKNTIH